MLLPSLFRNGKLATFALPQRKTRLRRRGKCISKNTCKVTMVNKSSNRKCWLRGWPAPVAAGQSCPSLPTKSTILHKTVLYKTYLGYIMDSYGVPQHMSILCVYTLPLSYVGRRYDILGTLVCTTTHVNPMCLSSPTVLWYTVRLEELFPFCYRCTFLKRCDRLRSVPFYSRSPFRFFCHLRLNSTVLPPFFIHV